MNSKLYSFNWTQLACAFGLGLATSFTSYSQNFSANPDLNSIKWIHGSANCDMDKADPNYQEWQQVQYSDSTYIFRQNKCSHYEGPFVYLFLGSEKGLLIDTGATIEGGNFLLELIRDITALPIVVAHSHGHSDHRLGDDAFRNKEGMTVVEISQTAVQDFFEFENWPFDAVTFELGGRDLQILPIPGHSDDDLAFYDSRTEILVTGDSLYPGRLYVREWDQYRESINRLANWMQGKAITYVLGTHIEMSATPNADYPVGTTFQPDEHQLPLQAGDIAVLRDSMEQYKTPERVPLGSFIIWPI